MNIEELQAAVGADPDGDWGTNSKKALLAAFANVNASPVGATELAAFAQRLGCTTKQLAAVAIVESSGGGFDKQGRPKILFERHKFHKYTGGRWSVSSFSNPSGGGYKESSWDKLSAAIAKGAVDAAFMACSWGKFQVLGEYWDDFGFASPFAFAHSTVVSEANHYVLLVDYVEMTHLQDEIQALSTDPNACRAFAKGYNGGGYEKFDYHNKLAKAMK